MRRQAPVVAASLIVAQVWETRHLVAVTHVQCHAPAREKGITWCENTATMKGIYVTITQSCVDCGVWDCELDSNSSCERLIAVIQQWHHLHLRHITLFTINQNSEHFGVSAFSTMLEIKMKLAKSLKMTRRFMTRINPDLADDIYL